MAPSSPRSSTHLRANSSGSNNVVFDSYDEENQQQQSGSASSSSHDPHRASQSSHWIGGGIGADSSGRYSQLPTSASQSVGKSSSSTSRSSPLQKAIQRIANRLVTPVYTLGLLLIFFLSIVRPSHPAGQVTSPSPHPQQTPATIEYTPAVAVAPNRPSRPVGPALSKAVQEDLSLSSSVCAKEFPLFYPQLQDNAAVWKQRGGLNSSHVEAAWKESEGGSAYVIISDGRVFIRNLTHDWQSRVKAMLALLQSAVESASWEERQEMEGIEFVFSTADKDGTHNDDGAGWVLDKRVTDKPGQYLIPDFSFAAWPEAGIATYAEFRREAEKVNQKWPWKTKKDKLFWRGDPNTGSPFRQSLLQQNNSADADQWSDIQRTSFWESGFSKIILPEDHCEHKYLLHSEGNSYSGRSKYILGCSSAVVMHRLEWTQHFHPALIGATDHADRNIIEMSGPLFEGLGSKIKELQAQDRRSLKSWVSSAPPSSEAATVAANAHRTLTQRYLSPAATACYIRAALHSYSTAMDRASWNKGRGPRLVPGGGVKPGAGAGDFKGDRLKELGIQGDIDVDTWKFLGQPAWPPS